MAIAVPSSKWSLSGIRVAVHPNHSLEAVEVFKRVEHWVKPKGVDPALAERIVGMAINNYKATAELHQQIAEAYLRGLEQKLARKQAKLRKKV